MRYLQRLQLELASKCNSIRAGFAILAQFEYNVDKTVCERVRMLDDIP
jgi:hypothetical protein